MELTREELMAMRQSIVEQEKYDFINNVDVIKNYIYNGEDNSKIYFKINDAKKANGDEFAQKLSDMIDFYAFRDLPINVDELSDMEVFKLYCIIEAFPFALKEDNTTLTDILVMSLESIRGLNQASIKR